MQNTFHPACPTSTHTVEESWKQELSHSYSTVSDLLENGLISPDEALRLKELGEKFFLRITPYYSRLMKNSKTCPIRRQAIPQLDEFDPQLPEWAKKASQEIYGQPYPWRTDAIGDLNNLAAPRLTHRYSNRALLHLSSLCAVYCRFCFRKSHLSDHEKSLYEGTLEPAFQYLAQHPSIHELILTGGDPFSLTDIALYRLFQKISTLPQIRIVRIHSRMAATLPSRFTKGLLEVLKSPWNFTLTLANHFNHPLEITPQAEQAIRNLRYSGITLLNQSVLLKGINDSSEILADLFQSLYERGVIPFYLHHPDWTPGTFHFRTSIERSKEIYSQLKGKISGPALPALTLDIPSGFGKISLLESHHKKLKDLSAPSDPFHGAIYEFRLPDTRNNQPKTMLYLDLSKQDDQH